MASKGPQFQKQFRAIHFLLVPDLSPWHRFSMKFNQVTAEAKANVYFDGKVISHTIIMPDESKKTLGVILPGSYHFGTEAAERMDIVGGSCEVTLDCSEDRQSVECDSSFEVPANSGFTIHVAGEPCHYVCSFLS